jgi:hypothetical protein
MTALIIMRLRSSLQEGPLNLMNRMPAEFFEQQLGGRSTNWTATHMGSQPPLFALFSKVDDPDVFQAFFGFHSGKIPSAPIAECFRRGN